jgi:glutaminase
VDLPDHEFLAGLTGAELDRLLPQLGMVTAGAGSLLVRRGEPASELFLVTRGSLSVVGGKNGGPRYRLTTLSAGMTFGELAFVARGTRAADVCADTEVTCATLPYATIDALAQSDPDLHGKLLRNLLQSVVGILHVVNAEVAHLTR